MHSATIHFTTFRCGLGWLLVARTGRGVCRLRFGEAPHELTKALREDFPWAELHEDAPRLASCVAALERYLEGRSRKLDLPLDVRGSQFQRRVWEAIRAIPYGQTRSYGQLARSIGRPSASRAVAGACGANPVALVVPCHRVVNASGTAGGYRWGVKRKVSLLKLEKKESSDSLSPLDSARGQSGDSRARPGAQPPHAGASARRDHRVPDPARAHGHDHA